MNPFPLLQNRSRREGILINTLRYKFSNHEVFATGFSTLPGNRRLVQSHLDTRPIVEHIQSFEVEIKVIKVFSAILSLLVTLKMLIFVDLPKNHLEMLRKFRKFSEMLLLLNQLHKISILLLMRSFKVYLEEFDQTLRFSVYCLFSFQSLTEPLE